MNPVATFFLIFLLSLIAFATFGLEIVLASKGTVNLTFAQALTASTVIGGFSAIFEYDRFKHWVVTHQSDFLLSLVGCGIIIWVVYYAVSNLGS